MELQRGENRALILQLETERRRTIEAQAMAAAHFRGGAADLERGGGGGGGGRRAGILALKLPPRWPAALRNSLEALDSFSSSLVHFLRREPVFRVAVVIYFLFMHLFVYIILHSGVSSQARGFDFSKGAHLHRKSNPPPTDA